MSGTHVNVRGSDPLMFFILILHLILWRQHSFAEQESYSCFSMA
jgi:hypothetical protein